ncbi:flavo-diiron protein FprA2 [Clostridium pasteurianum DSM 525 = ATCC 6013]|uniref:Flavo-diiron protein FprA2 n=1 Tax=Clostridium pasteurianum DSM 525 = ATCC 6013 TaxID=1262449 RepID=A0A0H3J5I1_CLOPA|nr:FAD-dependent oxidoreductase [Clostridium pasteurianum]AJA47158.1 flavo-diiron protein FprA2 [Clostridium pasteurianum DSM 525 = ATCC 6013]AJA51146.1 flavo-diiron protein FprA2 [Clostridium pasteurianum DSM 525 = ATCC 6013]AOZ74516.1 MBL fold metallo-hydrolase [Clostridium pasteurianum DSM 525 = ATCC 6013]AOZ78313.1 MBL fold metallo-hydrolase [Clostridium pasteurianum]ELP59455.1 rubredoxin/flavodoxin/oxidoreductase [Clostridium pasteurianum DSM 525 = ATCC 6013]
MKALEVKKNIYWVGALDPGLRIFDIIMYTPFGTTYNSYVVKGKNKTVVFETVKEKFFDQYLERLQSLNIDITSIDYIVVDHTEPDHVGSVAKLLDISKDAKVVGSSTAIKFLKGIVNHDFDYIEVKDGSTLDLGDKTLQFISAPLLHWPDSIYTYIPEDNMLITCDSFGCHYCSEEMFDDKIENYNDYLEALKYYFDGIMGPFKPYVLRALEKIKDLPIDTIGTGHGPILRKHHKEVIDMYKKWASENILDPKSIVIAYVSAYGYTKSLAEKIREGIQSIGDYNVELLDVIYHKQDEVINKLNTAAGILFGSPTINSDALKPILDLLNILNPIIHGGKPAAAFGSYGWSGEAVPNIERRLKELRLDVITPGLKVNFKPSEEDFISAYKFGESFGEKIKEHLNKSAKTKKKSSTKKWKCLVCGVIFDGSKPPEICPVCGAGQDQFIEVKSENVTFASDNREKFLIIGNGAAGFYAAEAIRNRNKVSEIEIISSEKYRTYYRPELSDYLSEDLPDNKLYVAPESWYTENNVTLTLDKTVKEIKPEDKKIILQDGSEKSYDKLILANGSRNFVPPSVEGTDKKGVYTLKSLDDASEIKEKLSKVKNAVVVGGGLLGLEAAWEMKKHGIKVSVIECISRLLPKQLDESGGKVFKDIADKSGIDIILEECAVKIQGDKEVTGVELKSGKIIAADLVLFSVGIVPNKEIAENAGIDVKRGIIVNERMETNKKDIYACGDAAEFNGIVYGNWNAAVEMGKTAGGNAAGDEVKFEDFVSSVIFNALNTSVLSLGEISPKDGKKIEVSDDNSGKIKTLFFKKDVFVGGYLIGDTTEGAKLILAMEDGKTLNEAFSEGLIV